jgi:hypothetical protein
MFARRVGRGATAKAYVGRGLRGKWKRQVFFLFFFLPSPSLSLSLSLLVLVLSDSVLPLLSFSYSSSTSFLSPFSYPLSLPSLVSFSLEFLP